MKVSICALFALLFAVSARGALTAPQIELPSVQGVMKAGDTAYKENRFLEAAALYRYAISRGAADANTHIKAARAFSLAGDREAAFGELESAIKSGLRSPERLKEDRDLAMLNADSLWKATVDKCKRAKEAYFKERSNPDRAKIVTSDIDLFWKVFDQMARAPEQQRVHLLESSYFRRGSIGLTDWAATRFTDANKLAAYMAKHPKFYPGVRAATLRIASLKKPIRAIYARMKELYPESLFPDVYFVMGGFNGGGTVSENGLLISAEMQVASPGVPTDELSTWEKSVFADAEELPAMIAHELVHFQQKYPDSDMTLLRCCIEEGSASFIGTLTTGWMGAREKAQHAYGRAHKKELWEKFQKDMNGTEIGKWLYSGSGEGIRPDDLGYWMGYEICEAYYNRSTDKKKAIRDILNIKDFPAFLKASGYAGADLP